MSFTAEVKDELSRVEAPSPVAELAQLSALVRICGTLSFYGSGRYSIRVATETGAVARTVIKLTHKLFDLETSLTVRRSVLHKTRNYLIEIPEQEGLDRDLVRMGILAPGRGLASGVPAALVATAAARSAYVRGAFMAGGFIAHDALDGLAGAELELRLDEYGHASAGAQPLQAGGQDEGQGYEGHVPDHQIHGFGDEFRWCGAQIDAFEADDAVIGAQFFVQLVFAYVHGVDAGGPVLQEAVGKAAGAGPGIQTDEAGHIQLEIFQDGQELVGSATDVALLFQQDEHGVFGVGMPRFVHLERRRAGREPFRGESDLAGHDETAGLLAAFGKALQMDEGIRALTGYSGTHARQCSRLPDGTQWRLADIFSRTGPQGLPKPQKKAIDFGPATHKP